jgi:hypothetical protein
LSSQVVTVGIVAKSRMEKQICPAAAINYWLIFTLPVSVRKTFLQKE